MVSLSKDIYIYIYIQFPCTSFWLQDVTMEVAQYVVTRLCSPSRAGISKLRQILGAGSPCLP